VTDNIIVSGTMPAVFIGHGSPMNAILENQYTRAWSALGLAIPAPKAILAVSAHWYVAQTGVTVSTAPRTIHDFGGFPPELYQVIYPAPGDPSLARRVQQLLEPLPVALDERWGLDHGTWSVLRHVYPEATVPVVQLSIDSRQPSAFHYETGKRLASLRDEGVLIVGSGNLVHNLRAYAWGRPSVDPYDWAARFEDQARQMIAAGEQRSLVDYDKLGSDASLSIPTPDHYLPLLYVLATRRVSDAVSFPIEGIDGGSVSMLGVRLG
jgi:4,5-DOPA dioxygenase extradiol